MIRLIDLLKEVKIKEPIVNLFRNESILDDGKYKNLLIHYIDSQHNLDQNEFTELVKWLLDNKSVYPAMLKPKSGYAYRGTSITPEMYQSIKNNPTTKKDGYTVIQSPYVSVNLAQSWTYDIKVAQRFADKGMFNNPRLEKGGRPAIIRVKIDDSFVGNPSLTNPIADKLSLKSEKEIFHYGERIDNAEYMILSADIVLGKLSTTPSN
jgi:hypothetical protein